VLHCPQTDLLSSPFRRQHASSGGGIRASHTLRDASDKSNFTTIISLVLLSIRTVTDQPLLERSFPIYEIQQRMRRFRDHSAGVVLRSNQCWVYCASCQRDRVPTSLCKATQDSEIRSNVSRTLFGGSDEVSRHSYTLPHEANRLEFQRGGVPEKFQSLLVRPGVAPVVRVQSYIRGATLVPHLLSQAFHQRTVYPNE
jgi:hypothetical protein